MAKVPDIEAILYGLGISMDSEKIKSIAYQIGDIDPKSAILKLQVHDIDKLTPTALLEKLKKLSKTTPTERKSCGCCQTWHIPIFDWRRVKESSMAIPNTTINFPKSMVSCPTCGVKPQDAAQVIASQTEDQQGWTWVILYEFIRYSLNKQIQPTEFNPTDYWPSLGFRPALSPAQLDMLDWIENPCQRPVPKPANTRTKEDVRRVLDDLLELGQRRMRSEDRAY